MNQDNLPERSFTEIVLLHLYSALLYLFAPFQLFRLWLKGKKLPAYRQRWRERFAHFPQLDSQPRIWLHSVSVGETIASAPVVERLIRDYPDYRVLVTTTTPTGSEQVRRLFADRVEHVYFPYDLPYVVRRFLNKTRPAMLLLMETELWPNVLHQCEQRGIPVLVGNARLSAKSLSGYQKVRRLLAPGLRSIRLVAAQADGDRGRFIHLGVPFSRVRVLGNIKSDIHIPEGIRQQGTMLRAELGENRPVWLAASTHQGEEEQVLEAHRQVLTRFSNALLLLVPRHPERFNDVAQMCDSEGFRCRRRSAREVVEPETQVYLGDTMGELLRLYAAADFSFVGGSLVPVGGHNALEPAALGKAVITGPEIRNFQAVYDLLLEKKAAIMVESSEQLAEQVLRWMDTPEQSAKAGRAAMAAVEETRGAVDRLVSVVDDTLKTSNTKFGES